MDSSVAGGGGTPTGSANTPTSPSTSPLIPSTSTSTSKPITTTTSPTIYVYYGSRHVKARIDSEVPLEEIIRQLTASSQLKISEPSSLFALRVESTGQLVTSNNLHSLLHTSKEKNVFTLCSSPKIEAIETIEKLTSNLNSRASEGGGSGGSGGGSGGSGSILKLTIFSLRTLIKDVEFLKEFLNEKRKGFEILTKVIEFTNGNTLAYALNVVKDLERMKYLQQGQEGILGSYQVSEGFIRRLIEIIITKPLINISRPATSILLYLIHHQKSFFPLIHSNLSKGPSSSSSLSKFLKNLISHLPRGDLGLLPGGERNTTTTDKTTRTGIAIQDLNESSELSLSLINSILKNLIKYDDQADHHDHHHYKEKDKDDDDDDDVKEEELISLEQFREELKKQGLYEIISSILNSSSSAVSTTSRDTTRTVAESSNLIELSKEFLSIFHQSLQQTYSHSIDDDDDLSETGTETATTTIGGGGGGVCLKEIKEWWEINNNNDSSSSSGGRGSRGSKEALRVFETWLKENHQQQQQSEKFLSPLPKNELMFVSFEITKILINHFNLLPPLLEPPPFSSPSGSPVVGFEILDINDPLLIFELKTLHRIFIKLWLKLFLTQQQQQQQLGRTGRMKSSRNNSIEEEEEEEKEMEMEIEIEIIKVGSKEWKKLTGLVKTLFNHSILPQQSGHENGGGGDTRRRRRSLKEIETLVEKSDYDSIRFLQLKEFEEINIKSLDSKALEKLRLKLEKDSLEFVKLQRIDCLRKGIWVPTTTTTTRTRVYLSENEDSNEGVEVVEEEEEEQEEKKWWFVRLISSTKSNDSTSRSKNSMMSLKWIQVENFEEKVFLENEIHKTSQRGGGELTNVFDNSSYKTGQIELCSIKKITTSTTSSTNTAAQTSTIRNNPDIKGSSSSSSSSSRQPTKLHRRNQSNSGGVGSGGGGRLSSFLIRSNNNNNNNAHSQSTSSSSLPVSTTSPSNSNSNSNSNSTPMTYSIKLHLSSSSSSSSENPLQPGRPPPALAVGGGVVVVNFYPKNLQTYSELLDSLNFLVLLLLPSTSKDSSSSSTPQEEEVPIPTELTETSLKMIQDLKLIGMKIKLLDLEGEGIEPVHFLKEEEEEVEMDKKGFKSKVVKSVPAEEERFYFREFI